MLPLAFVEAKLLFTENVYYTIEVKYVDNRSLTSFYTKML